MKTRNELYHILKDRLKESLSDQEFREKAEGAWEIQRLKKETGAVILGHNYIDPVLFHTVADITGDSLELSRKAAVVKESLIVVCGVSFMAETVKLLNPEKKVLLPVKEAGCSLADSITPADLRKLKRQYPGVPVVTYINTTAAVKAETDICCTSGNAAETVKSLNSPRVLFLPDRFLGANVAAETGKTWGYADEATEASLILWRGRCEVHEQFTPGQVNRLRRDNPGAEILAHPECPPGVVEAADFSGGTGDLARRIRESPSREFCLLTEAAFERNINLGGQEKRFVPLSQPRCPYMAKVTLENTIQALRCLRWEVSMDEETRKQASPAVKKMLLNRGSRR